MNIYLWILVYMLGVSISAVILKKTEKRITSEIFLSWLLIIMFGLSWIFDKIIK